MSSQHSRARRSLQKKQILKRRRRTRDYVKTVKAEPAPAPPVAAS